MTGRIGDEVDDPALVRCEGCFQTLLICQVCWDAPKQAGPCCDVCTHIHVSPPPSSLRT